MKVLILLALAVHDADARCSNKGWNVFGVCHLVRQARFTLLGSLLMLLRSDGRGLRAACVSVAEHKPTCVHWWNRRGVGVLL